MKMPTKDCERMLELDLTRADGFEFDEEERAFFEHHLANCPECCMEDTLLDLLVDDGTSGALPMLDDLSHRRMVEEIVDRADAMEYGRGTLTDPIDVINDVLARADDPLEPLEAKSEDRGDFWNRGAKNTALVSTLAAACVAAVILWTAFPAGPPPPSKTEPSPVPVPAPVSVSGEFALLAGDVFVDGRHAVIGDRIESGDLLETQNGQAVVTLSTDITLSLGPETRADHRHGRERRPGSVFGIRGRTGFPGTQGKAPVVSSRHFQGRGECHRNHFFGCGGAGRRGSPGASRRS